MLPNGAPRTLLLPLRTSFVQKQHTFSALRLIFRTISFSTPTPAAVASRGPKTSIFFSPRLLTSSPFRFFAAAKKTKEQVHEVIDSDQVPEKQKKATTRKSASKTSASDATTPEIPSPATKTSIARGKKANSTALTEDAPSTTAATDATAATKRPRRKATIVQQDQPTTATTSGAYKEEETKKPAPPTLFPSRSNPTGNPTKDPPSSSTTTIEAPSSSTTVAEATTTSAQPSATDADKPKKSINPNQVIIDELEQLEKIYEGTGDKWRAMAYKNAVSTIKSLNYKITSADQVKGIRGIGKRTVEKIDEILKKGHLQRLEDLKKDEETNVIPTFMGIWGVGPNTAKAWYTQGYRTLEDLEKGGVTMTKQQQIGLKYYEDFKHRIPREEVSKIESLVKSAALEINPNLQVICCGSYRRGLPTSGDVDILMCYPKDYKRDPNKPSLLGQLIDLLHQKKLLTDDLSTVEHSHKADAYEKEMYMGVCKLPESPYHRRIDIKMYPPHEFAFALLYFTGSHQFNRNMRQFALSKGLTLSDNGLRHVTRIAGENIAEGPSIVCNTEQEIFDAIGMPYRDPPAREE